jgi:hypothetical protein
MQKSQPQAHHDSGDQNTEYRNFRVGHGFQRISTIQNIESASPSAKPTAMATR